MSKEVSTAGVNWAGFVPQGAGPYLSIELVRGSVIDLKYGGDMALIIQMLYDCMSAREDLAKMLVSAVCVFADQKKIPLADLEKHSFIQRGKIIPL